MTGPENDRFRRISRIALLLGLVASGPATRAAPGFEAAIELDHYTRETSARIVFDNPGAGNTALLRVRAVTTGSAGPMIAEAPLAANGPTWIELPLADFPEGTAKVRLSILRGDRPVWQGTDTLTKLPPPATGARDVQVDRFRRILLIDGEPFFPMGVFGVFPADLPEVAEAGFNLTMRWKGATTRRRYDHGKSRDDAPNRASVRDYLDAAHAAGLLALEAPVKLAEEDLYMKYRDSGWHAKFSIINTELTPGVVRLARTHPAMIGYYSYDEPDNFYPDTPDHPKHLLMQAGVEQWYETVRSLDPYHPVFTLFAVGLDKVEGWKAWDVGLRDFYPEQNQPMSHVYDRAAESARVAWKLRTPFVFTPLFEESSARPVPLGPGEQRAQTWLALAADVKGLFYWDWPALYEPNWRMLRQLAGEVRGMAPILLEPAPAQKLSYRDAASAKSVKALIKNHAGKAWLITVNAEPAPAHVNFRLPGTFNGRVEERFSRNVIPINDGGFADTLEPYGRRVYALPGEWPEHGEITLSIHVGESTEKPELVFPALGKNLLVNGSFEYDHTRLPGWPFGWHPGDSIMESGVVGNAVGRWNPDTQQAQHAKRSLRLIKTADGIADSDGIHNLAEAPAAEQKVRIPAAGIYTLSVWLRAEKAARVRLSAGWANSVDVEAGTDWQRHQLTFQRTGSGNDFVRIQLLQQGTLWIDSAQLEAGGKTSDFETNEPE